MASYGWDRTSRYTPHDVHRSCTRIRLAVTQHMYIFIRRSNANKSSFLLSSELYTPPAHPHLMLNPHKAIIRLVSRACPQTYWPTTSSVETMLPTGAAPTTLRACVQQRTLICGGAILSKTYSLIFNRLPQPRSSATLACNAARRGQAEANRNTRCALLAWHQCGVPLTTARLTWLHAEPTAIAKPAWLVSTYRQSQRTTLTANAGCAVGIRTQPPRTQSYALSR